MGVIASLRMWEWAWACTVRIGAVTSGVRVARVEQVWEVAPPKPKPQETTSSNDVPVGDDGIVLVGSTGGTNMALLPHPRSECPTVPPYYAAAVDLSTADSKVNQRRCANCFCRVCEVPAIKVRGRERTALRAQCLTPHSTRAREPRPHGVCHSVLNGHTQ